MENLKLLEILNNNFMYAGYPSRELSRLTSLQTLSINVFKNFSFDENFTMLRNLHTVLLFSQNPGIRLTNESFMGLRFSPITSLYIFIRQYGVSCDIADDMLQWFPVVRVLNVRIPFVCNVTRVLRSLKALEGRAMDYFIATYNVQAFGDLVVLDEWAIGSMLNTCIKTVNLAHNNIGSFILDVKGTLFEKCIRDLDLSNNMWEKFDISFARFLTSSNLKTLNVEGAWSMDNFFNLQIFQRFLSPNATVYLAKSLEKINFSHNKLHPMLLDHQKIEITFAADGLKELHLHHSNIEGTIVTRFQFPNLQLLNISFPMLESEHYMFSCELFSALRHLETLDVTKAFLSRILNYNANCFRGLKNLKSLNISSNELTFLHQEIFRDQTETLETLILDYNLLEVIPQAIGYMRFLFRLSLRFNKIKTISKTDHSMLNQFSDNSVVMAGNPLFCSCKYEQSLMFIRLTARKFEDIATLNCSEFDGKTPPDLHRLFEFSNWRAYQLSCVSTFWLEFSSVLISVVILITVCVTLACKYRIFLEYIGLRLRLRLRGKKTEKERELYKYDVFICYSGFDQDWVVTELYQHLTNSDFKVCLDEKNFIPGCLIAEEIVRCIDESRKILFVVTRNFLQSKWAGYEVQMAITHAFHNHVESKIVVLLKDEIPLRDMPEQLKRILVDNRVFKMADNGCGERRAIILGDFESFNIE